MAREIALENALNEATSSIQEITSYLDTIRDRKPRHDHDLSAALLPNGAPQTIRSAQKRLAESAIRLLELATDPREYLEQQAVHVSPLLILCWRGLYR